MRSTVQYSASRTNVFKRKGITRRYDKRVEYVDDRYILLARNWQILSPFSHENPGSSPRPQLNTNVIASSYNYNETALYVRVKMPNQVEAKASESFQNFIERLDIALILS